MDQLETCRWHGNLAQIFASLFVSLSLSFPIQQVTDAAENIGKNNNDNKANRINKSNNGSDQSVELLLGVTNVFKETFSLFSLLFLPVDSSFTFAPCAPRFTLRMAVFFRLEIRCRSLALSLSRAARVCAIGACVLLMPVACVWFRLGSAKSGDRARRGTRRRSALWSWSRIAQQLKHSRPATLTLTSASKLTSAR